MRSFLGLALIAVTNAQLTWTWENNITSATTDAEQNISLNFDVGATYAFPLGWDKAGNYFFDTNASLYAGGQHYVEYYNDYFEAGADLWTYPVWWDAIYNELEIQWNNYRVCESLWTVVHVGKIYLDFWVGIYTCESTFYDYFVDENDITHTCAFTYYGFDNIVNYDYRNWSYELWPNTCNYEEPAWVYIDEPAGPSEDTREEAADEETLEEEKALEDTTTTESDEVAALRI